MESNDTTYNQASLLAKDEVKGRGYMFSLGFKAGITYNKEEIQYHQMYMGIKYKQSFLAYKLMYFWPVIDFLANYFYLILNLTIFIYALLTWLSAGLTSARF